MRMIKYCWVACDGPQRNQGFIDRLGGNYVIIICNSTLQNLGLVYLIFTPCHQFLLNMISLYKLMKCPFFPITYFFAFTAQRTISSLAYFCHLPPPSFRRQNTCFLFLINWNVKTNHCNHTLLPLQNTFIRRHWLHFLPIDLSLAQVRKENRSFLQSLVKGTYHPLARCSVKANRHKVYMWWREGVNNLTLFLSWLHSHLICTGTKNPLRFMS